ncbi:MAG: LLM class F420-dependent oxidoreductase [Thermoleophilia bacterium]
MELCIHFPNFTLPGGPEALPGHISATARAAEEGGATTFTFMDHWFQLSSMGGALNPMMEGYTSLGFVAARTTRIRLGLLVTGVTYRHPGLLAKTVTTLDVLSGGRAQLGLGAAWYEREHQGMGVRYPPVGERLGRLEETVEIVRQMWSDDDGPYEGRYYTLAETLCLPQPVSSPAPPLMIAGGGEKRLLRLVARHADACNLMALGDGGLDEVAHKLRVLDGHCAAVGREPAEVRRTIISDLDPHADPDGFLRQMEGYAALGVSQVYVMPFTDDPEGWARRVTDRLVVPLGELGP